MSSTLSVDVVVFGGGAAGLWTLDVLSRRGFRCLLIEKTALGTGQTIGSQGIIHGGLKYSLEGLLTPSAYQIRQMPGIWRECLQGTSQPDLSDVALRSEGCYLWRTDSLSSRLGMLGAQIGLQVTPQSISRADRPEIIKDVPGHVAVMPEQVISPVSFLDSLARRWSSHLILLRHEDQMSFECGHDGTVTIVRIAQGRHRCELDCRFIVLAAGTGNAGLRNAVGLSAERMQRRPLHMVLAKGDLPLFCGHCVDGSRTRVTITSEKACDGQTVWQIGGQIAESGVSLAPEELMMHTARELQAVIPGFNPGRAVWSTYRVDRAEGLTSQGKRPDQPVVHTDGNVITVWPTKLAFAPSVAEQVETLVSSRISPSQPWTALEQSQLDVFEKPNVAAPPWELVDSWWQLQPNQQPIPVHKAA